jgi:hypothetical protein
VTLTVLRAGQARSVTSTLIAKPATTP